jgi:hypothetical protein
MGNKKKKSGAKSAESGLVHREELKGKGEKQSLNH